MDQGILNRLHRDLGATGLDGRIDVQSLFGDIDAVGLLEEEDDPDRPHSGTVGLAHRLPLMPAGLAARELRAAAEFLQSYLIEAYQLQWPVCVAHASTILTPCADQEHASVWVCASGQADSPQHVISDIGLLKDVASRVGAHGRRPRLRRNLRSA